MSDYLNKLCQIGTVHPCNDQLQWPCCRLACSTTIWSFFENIDPPDRTVTEHYWHPNTKHLNTKIYVQYWITYIGLFMRKTANALLVIHDHQQNLRNSLYSHVPANGTGLASRTFHISSTQAASQPQGCWPTPTLYFWPVIPPVCSKYMEWEVLQHGVRVLIDNPSQWDTLISIAEKFWMILSYGSILLSPKNFDKCDVMFNGRQIQFSVPLTGTWLYTVLCSCTEWEKKPRFCWWCPCM